MSTWGRYITARVGAARAQNRLCSGGLLARSFAFDIGYVVMAPFEIAGSISEGSEGDGKAMFAYMILPVAGAIGLAADAILTVTLPVTLPTLKFKARRQTRRAALAFKEFTDLVVEFEGPGPR
ncbi:MAG: hypothetical protein PHS14_08705 [Elusimicrobia bacterium]|nr:hypothetical protein [Elusimicrobiota bacterium]